LKQRRAGTYYLEETLTLAPEDSGVTYAAYPGERAILSGGRPITGWTRKENARLLTAPAPFDFHQLFIGGRRAVRVRAPHHGFYRVDGRIMQAKPAVFKFRGDTISKAWAEKGDVEGAVLCAWQEVRGRITAVDEAAHTVQLAAEAPPNMLRGGRDCTYWVENTPEPPTYLLGHNWKGGLKMDHNLYWDARGAGGAAGWAVVEGVAGFRHGPELGDRRSHVRQPRQLRLPPEARLTRVEDGLPTDRHVNGGDARHGRTGRRAKKITPCEKQRPRLLLTISAALP